MDKEIYTGKYGVVFSDGKILTFFYHAEGYNPGEKIYFQELTQLPDNEKNRNKYYALVESPHP
jgi:hypothetical protein